MGGKKCLFAIKQPICSLCFSFALTLSLYCKTNAVNLLGPRLLEPGVYPHHEEMSGKLGRSKKGSSSSEDSANYRVDDLDDENLFLGRGSKRSRNNNTNSTTACVQRRRVWRFCGKSWRYYLSSAADGWSGTWCKCWSGVHLDPTMMVSSSSKQWFI